MEVTLSRWMFRLVKQSKKRGVKPANVKRFDDVAIRQFLLLALLQVHLCNFVLNIFDKFVVSSECYNTAPCHAPRTHSINDGCGRRTWSDFNAATGQITRLNCFFVLVLDTNQIFESFDLGFFRLAFFRFSRFHSFLIQMTGLVVLHWETTHSTGSELYPMAAFYWSSFI